MIDETIEFLISQYADGTISPADQAMLEQHLAQDADARLLVREYQKLDGVLRISADQVPGIDWDRFDEQLSQAMDEQEASQYQRMRIGWWKTGLSIAASVALAVGLWMHMGTNVATEKKGTIQVAVLTGGDALGGPAVKLVQVGPPAAAELASARFISEAIVTVPNTLFIAKADNAGQDTAQTPY